MAFHWSLSDSKFPQVSWTLLSILTDLNNAVLWIVSVLLISSSSDPISKIFGTIPCAPNIICITVTLIVHNFLVLWQVLSICLSFHFQLFPLSGLEEMAKFTRWQVLFYLLIIAKSDLLIRIRWFTCTSKSLRVLWVSFSRVNSGCVCTIW